MYGLLLENIAAFVRLQWGEGRWEAVRKNAGIDIINFSVGHVYSEVIITKLCRSAVEVLGVNEKDFLEASGVYFVEFVGQYGYDQVLSVLGRHLRDFLCGLDNLHEYMKFAYPRMRAPSFYVDKESETGLQLHYRSKRRGFVPYVCGQIKQVAKHFYGMDCGIQILSEILDGDTMHIVFQLEFNNEAFNHDKGMKSMIHKEERLPVRGSILFELFPFCIVFGPDMIIQYIGHSLMRILPDIVGQCMTETFDLVRPPTPFIYHNLVERNNNVFELITVAPLRDDESLGSGNDDDGGGALRLRGQMMEMPEWEMIMFLASPVMGDLDGLLSAGLYLNDLSLHDSSRELVLAGTQQAVELRKALEQEQHKTAKLEFSMKELDMEKQRTDELLYQMIPRTVADRIRRGENPVDTCEHYECVTILFSDVVTFTEICSRITPMQVVAMLNHMYSLFDQLTERNGVYKVETIGDAYMVVSGAPIADSNHAERICDMALDMIDASEIIRDPSNPEAEHLKLRIGVHSGTVVAGVVGLKMPRWCLFGDCVNTSSRMESTSEGGKVQISEMTKALIPSIYEVEYRGEVAVKGKGMMGTYWLNGRDKRPLLTELQCQSFVWTPPVSYGSDNYSFLKKKEEAESGGKKMTQTSQKPSFDLFHAPSATGKVDVEAAKAAITQALNKSKKPPLERKPPVSESKPEPKPEPKLEPKPEPKVEPKVEPKEEPKEKIPQLPKPPEEEKKSLEGKSSEAPKAETLQVTTTVGSGAEIPPQGVRPKSGKANLRAASAKLREGEMKSSDQPTTDEPQIPSGGAVLKTENASSSSSGHRSIEVNVRPFPHACPLATMVALMEQGQLGGGAAAGQGKTPKASLTSPGQSEVAEKKWRTLDLVATQLGCGGFPSKPKAMLSAACTIV